MLLKLDENLDCRLADELRALQHDADTVKGEGLGGRDDPDVLAATRGAGRVLLTLDLDFANPLRHPPEGEAGIVVLRPSRPSLPLVRALVLAVAAELPRRRVAGKLIVAEPGRLRVFPPDA